MARGLYVADAAMLVLAVLAAVAAYPEWGRRVIPRWRLLLPGVLAGLSTACLIGYPAPGDLLELERWMVGAAALLAGAARGSFIRISSDRVFHLVRLRRAADGLVVASALALFAAFETVVDLRAAAESRFEPTIEVLMTLCAGYLFGRAVAVWFRAGANPHYDLGEE